LLWNGLGLLLLWSGPGLLLLWNGLGLLLLRSGPGLLLLWNGLGLLLLWNGLGLLLLWSGFGLLLLWSGLCLNLWFRLCHRRLRLGTIRLRRTRGWSWASRNHRSDWFAFGDRLRRCKNSGPPLIDRGELLTVLCC
jgi:hypothetical protein